MNGKPNTKCPSCGADGMQSFYKVQNVPVHSCLMFSTEHEALEFPRGDIDLGFCASCGFIANMVFDPGVQDYSALYEDQQCYSPTFNAFAQRLAGSLIQKYDIRDKDVIEIGCGKADFLALICEMGNNRGVGIDPSCEADRIEGPARERITIIQDYYSEKYGHFKGDVVLCRHTLEHIHNTHAFVQTVRDAIGGRKDCIVVFEIPDVSIVLKDIVFWDVYYEHCSYFSPGSLARLFRSCGFEVLDVYVDYGDQYLLIEARPALSASSKTHPLEETLEEMDARVDRFRSKVGAAREYWRATVKSMNREGRPAVIWGSGSKCVAFLTTLGVSDEIGGVIDINPHRHGKYLAGTGKRIMPPEFLRDYGPTTVIVMNPIYKDEIARTVASMNVPAEVITV